MDMANKHFLVVFIFLAIPFVKCESCINGQVCLQNCPQIQEIQFEMESIRSRIVLEILDSYINNQICTGNANTVKYCCDPPEDQLKAIYYHKGMNKLI